MFEDEGIRARSASQSHTCGYHTPHRVTGLPLRISAHFLKKDRYLLGQSQTASQGISADQSDSLDVPLHVPSST